MALLARSVLVGRVSRVVTIHLLCQSVPLPLGLLKFPSYPDALLMLGSVQAGEGMLVLGDHVVWRCTGLWTSISVGLGSTNSR